MAQEPKDAHLWQMVIAQARARFSTYPSPGASHWVHEEYVKKGGQFVDTSKDTQTKERWKKAAQKKQEKYATHKKSDDKDKK
jgi:hypothetical protein